MQYSSRFWLYAPFALVLALAAWVMTHWWLTAGALEKKLAATKGTTVMPGITVDWSSVTIGGFPFRVDADFTNLRIEGAGAHGPFAWRTEKFAMHALAYGRSKTVYEAAGPQQLAWTDKDGKGRQFEFIPGSLHASSIIDARGLARFDLDIVNLGSPRITAGRFQFHIRREAESLKMMVQAETVRGSGVDQKLVQAYGDMNRLDMLMPLLQGHTPWPVATMVWRDNGGRATLSQTAAPDLAQAVLSVLY
jgi:hypothetical protein